ncbi:MAG: AAA family ATPase [Acidobacteria bacterium]|nr:MAG: AAA family ATPase [Acidobacteriota bacterium]
MPSPADPTPAEAVNATDDQPRQALPMQGIPAAYAGKMVLHRDVHKVWEAARAVTRSGTPMVVAMVGPSGAGKTHAVHALAAAEGLDVVKYDASGVVEPGDWFGTVVLDGNGTRFVASDLLSAITLPGPRVLLIDEVNRANLRALNAMLPLLDGSGTITIPQTGKRERVNLQVQIVVTANIGSAFLATEPLDEAIRTRVGAWIEVDHLSEADEASLLADRVDGLEAYDAGTLARLGAAVREAAQNGQHPPVSTRQLLAAARFIAAGLDARLAVDAAVLNGYLAEGGASSERSKVKPHVVGITWKQPLPEPLQGEAGDVFTAADTDAAGRALCQCGHTAEQHGIGTDISASLHCRADGPGHCNAYQPRMTAAGTVGA